MFYTEKKEVDQRARILKNKILVSNSEMAVTADWYLLIRVVVY